MPKPGHDVVSVNELLSRDYSYTIPKYQRGYSWDETNFKELWEDIKEKALKNNEDLFLGSIILAEKPSKIYSKMTYEIVDGQQRLITFTILIRAIHDHLVDMPDQDRFRRELYRLIGDDSGSRFKLTLGDEDEDFFLKYIKKQDRESHRKGVKKSHKMIHAAYELFFDAIAIEMSSGKYNSKIDFLDRLFESIKQKTQLLEITVSDEFDAYAIFESINAKRVDLTPAELIKNYVFSAVSRNESELNKIQQDWADILDELSPQNKDIAITNYIRHHWIATIGDVREKELYRTIKEKYKAAPSQIPGFIENLSKSSSSYAAIVYPEIIQTTNEGINVNAVVNINRFNFKQTYPLILSALINKIPQTQFDELLQILQTTILRRSIRGSNPNELEEVLSSCARQINKNGVSSLENIKNLLRKLTPSDASIKEDLINSSYVSNSKIILEEYEMSLSTGEKIIKNPTVEHIMPQNPTMLDSWSVGMEEHEHWLNNIGNLTLLGRPLNSSASNADFKIKKEIYKKTDYKITKKLSEYDVWSPALIRKRAQVIATFVTSHWRSY